MLSISIMAIPAFISAPTTIALTQFRTIYDIGKVLTPPCCLFTAGTFFYLSYQSYSLASSDYLTVIGARAAWEWKAYAVAGTLAGAVVVFTYAVLERTSQWLLRLGRIGGVKQEEGEGKRKVEMLLRKWGWLNLVRSGMLGASAIIGVWAILG
jgi:hypothetical protein